MVKKGKTRVETLVSAGGVVYRQREGRLETVLCGHWITSNAAHSRSGQGDGNGEAQTKAVRWSLAKGTPDAGETMEETALREVREETGLEVEMQEPISSITYWFADRENAVRYHKTVHFYLMAPVGGDVSLHDPEFDVVRWFSMDEALNILIYPNETTVMRQANELISQRIGNA
mgnify:CR=1 FL=1